MKILFYFDGDLVLTVFDPKMYPAVGSEVRIIGREFDGRIIVESLLWIYDETQGDRLEISLKELP